MIIIKNILNSIKIFSIFILLEVFISFIIGLFNLMGITNYLSKVILVILNLIIFFIYGHERGKKTNHKGLIEGLITSSILIGILFIINLIIFQSKVTTATLLYYIILLTITLIGSTIGKNKKIDSTPSEKK